MSINRIKSFAKINLALNIIGKNSSLHQIESLVAFVSLHDDILIKKIKSSKHNISFYGKFRKKVNRNNTVSRLLNILEKKNFLKDKKFNIKIKKNIPPESGLGGGSMNAASILKFFVKKKIIKINNKQLIHISKSVGSDVIFGLNSSFTILNSKNKIKHFSNCKKIYTLIVKPNFGCSTKKIYSKVKKFSEPKFDKLNKKMFDLKYLKIARNDLEPIVMSMYPKLRIIKQFLQTLSATVFVRMTGSGSALVAYFQTKENCDKARRQFCKKYKNYWCIASKTI